MRFYPTQHQFYCGIDLHTRSMFLCIMNHSGKVLFHRNYRAEPDALLSAITPYRQVPEHDPVGVHLLCSIPGVGKTLALVILYEIHDIHRFPTVGNFISYARLVKCTHESGGKRKTGPNNKIGNVHLKWAFSEAACLFLRKNERAKLYHRRLVSKYGKAKALSIIAQKLGRTVYTMLKRRTPYDARRFFETLT